MADPAPTRRVVVDADLGVPPPLAGRAGIIVTPPDPPLLFEHMNIPRLILEAGGALDAGAVIEDCRRAARDARDTILYVAPGDGHGHPDGVEDAARAAVEAAGGRLLYLAAPDALMAAGWRAVLAAEALARGAGPEDALARAQAATAHCFALVDHPELAGHSAPGNLGTPNRVVAWLRGAEFAVEASPDKRDTGLRILRDRFAASVRDTDPTTLRIAVQHGGVAPAAQAMATWIDRHIHPAEVHVAPLTKHAATRLGPGYLGIAWVVEDGPRS